MADEARKSRKRKIDSASGTSTNPQCACTYSKQMPIEKEQTKRLRGSPLYSQSIVYSTTNLPSLMDIDTPHNVSAPFAFNNIALQQMQNTHNGDFELQPDFSGIPYNLNYWNLPLPFTDWEFSSAEDFAAKFGQLNHSTQLIPNEDHAVLWGNNTPQCLGEEIHENLSSNDSSFSGINQPLSPYDISLPSSQSTSNTGDIIQHNENGLAEPWLEGWDTFKFLDLDILNSANDKTPSKTDACNQKDPNELQSQTHFSPLRSADYGHSSGNMCNGKQIDLKWQNTVAHSDPPQQTRRQKDGVPEAVINKPRKLGRRQGPLSPENAKRTSQMRRLGACWPCYILKTPCSPEKICHRCTNAQTPFLNGNQCIRRLSDHTELFFPAPIVSHLQKSAVELLISENVLKFHNTSIKIHVSSGPAYPYIELSARQFEPANEDFLSVQRLDIDSHKMVQHYAMPLGFSINEMVLLEEKCRKHIKGIIAQARDPLEVEYGNISPVSCEAFKAIERYRKLSKPENDSLLQKAAMLYAMHYFISRDLMIIDEPENRIAEDLHLSPNLPYNFEIPSRLLNRQIKHVMHQLLRETTKEVLEDLDRELRGRTKQSWAPCFCCILILCICTEEIQIAVDGFAVHNQPKQDSMSRKTGAEISRKLVDELIMVCKYFFHEIYRTSKGGTRYSKGGFNPLRYGFDIDEKEGLTPAMHDLVEDIRRVIETHHVLEHQVTETSEQTLLDREDQTIASHMDFRRKNSGRLVSKFLCSFY